MNNVIIKCVKFSYSTRICRQDGESLTVLREDRFAIHLWRTLSLHRSFSERACKSCGIFYFNLIKHERKTEQERDVIAKSKSVYA